MTQRLIIYTSQLPTDTNASTLQWFVADEVERIFQAVSFIECQQQAQKADDILLLIPGMEVFAQYLEIPLLNRSKERHNAMLWALKDKTVVASSHPHFSTSTHSLDSGKDGKKYKENHQSLQPYFVQSIDESLLQQTLAYLTTQGIPVSAIYCLHALFAQVKQTIDHKQDLADTSHSVFNDDAKQWRDLVYQNSARGSACFWSNQAPEDTVAIIENSESHCTDSDILLALQHDAEPLWKEPAVTWVDSLYQGRYLLLSVISILSLSFIGYGLWAGQSFVQATQELQQQHENQYRQWFPNEPIRSLERQIRAKLRYSDVSVDANFSANLSNIATAIHAVQQQHREQQQLQLIRISYDASQADMTALIRTASIEQLETLREKLNLLGVESHIISATRIGSGVESTVRLYSGGF